MRKRFRDYLNRTLTRRQLKGIIIGTVYGDTHLSLRKDYKNASIFCEHSIKQKEWLEYKIQFFQKLFKYQLRLVERERKVEGKNYKVVYCQTRIHPRLTQIYKLTHKNGKKTFNRKALDYIDEQGLAVWYQDDGFLVKDKRGRYTIGLSLYTSYEEARIVQDWLKEKWNINLNTHHHKSGFCLTKGIGEGYKLIEIMKPYIIPSMEYKIEYCLKRKPYKLSVQNSSEVAFKAI